jgi:hypothetical protein
MLGFTNKTDLLSAHTRLCSTAQPTRLNFRVEHDCDPSSCRDRHSRTIAAGTQNVDASLPTIARLQSSIRQTPLYIRPPFSRQRDGFPVRIEESEYNPNALVRM